MNAGYSTTVLALCLGFACSSTSEKDRGFGRTDTDTGAGQEDSGLDGIQGEKLHSPRDKAQDLVLDGEQLYYSTQYDPAIVRWDPDSGEVENVAWDLRDLQAIAVVDGLFFGSFSDSGVEGWVSEISPPKNQIEWASQGSDGTLFRRPSDLLSLNGALYMVDQKINVLWKLSGEGGSVQALASAESMLCLTAVDGELLLGGEDGVFDLGGSQIDNRPALALANRGGRAFGVHPNEGLFEVGGEGQWSLLGPARPGPFTWKDGELFVVDEVAGAIWRFELAP
jgi:hypothetical protein